MRKDIDFSFTKHPVTGDLAVKRGSNAISQSMKNCVLTSFYERGFNIEFGTNVNSSLFSNMTPLDVQTLKDTINQSIKNFEPQVEVDTIKVEHVENEIRVKIYYREYNNIAMQTVAISLAA